MGSLYRSEEMRFCQMIVERDAAFACVAELGKKPYVQFKDLNADVNSFQRMFAKDIRRFDEMERKLSGILNN
uniref:V-type proton ATPase subunit a n=1 Tax=Meloidogyne floridensis TaxID=298350 RepID=A0A915NAG7_9BILA